MTLVISAGTIEDAARDGVELVVEAANAVGMPESDIATLVVTSASDQYRRNTAADHPSG